jgi:O-antigen/teichoic acid export membrane protein
VNLKNKILNLSSHKKELLKGSFDTIIIKIVGILVGYIFIMILSRNYGAETVGIYQIFVQSLGIIGIIVLFGFNQSIIRFSAELIANNNIVELKLLLKKFSLITLFISIFASVILFLLAEKLAVLFLKDISLKYIFEYISYLLPFYAINILIIETIRGLRKIKVSEFLRLFLTKFLTLTFFLIVLLFTQFSILVPIISYSIATILTISLSIFFIYKYIKKYKNNDNSKIKNKSYISTSFTMYQSALLVVIANQMVIFILAYYTNPANVGIYNIAFQLAALSSFVFGAVTTITAPKYAELFHNESKEHFKETVLFSSKLVFWTTGSISIFTMLFSSWLMGMFGDEFIEGSLILIILSLGNFINAFTGSGGVLLDMVGKQSIRRNILTVSMLITLFLSFLLIPQYGGLGLAYALLVNQVISNFISVYYVKKLLGINLIYTPFLTRKIYAKK